MFKKIKQLTRKTSLLATVISLLTITVVLAASGDLDTTFDGDGLVTTDLGRSDIAQGIAIQPADGKIIAVGYSYIPSTATQDFAAARYNVDGTLDNAFSTDGLLTTDFTGRDTAFDVAIQSNGKIVVSGLVCAAPNTKGTCDAAVARYNTDGTPDNNFSSDGRVTTDFGGKDNGSKGGIAIQSNGKILVGGYMYNGTNKTFDFAIYRYNSNGSLDTTFSGDGKALFGFGKGRHDYAEDIILQSDGKILVAGETCDKNYANCDFGILRLNPGGTLDKNFSGDGKQTTNFGGDDKPYAVTLQPNGRIVVVGKKIASTQSFAVARYTASGSLDTSFNGTGKKVFSVIPSSNSYASDVLVQSDNKIVIAGSAQNGSLYDFALVRLNSTGSFDSTFSDDGLLTIDFGGDDYGQILALQPSDGSYVLAGYTDDGTQRDFALTRILP